MIATAPTLRLGVGFAKNFPRFFRLPQAGQQLWEVLWGLTHFGTIAVRVTDRKLAELCGRKLRWVQKALRQLLAFDDGAGDPIPVIDRFFRYGPREEAGRMIQIIVPFVEAAAPAQSSARPSTPPRARGKSQPPVAPSKPAPPPAMVAPVPTPEEIAAGLKVMEDLERRRKAREAADVRSARPKGRMTREEMNRQLDEVRRRSGGHRREGP